MSAVNGSTVADLAGNSASGVRPEYATKLQRLGTVHSARHVTSITPESGNRSREVVAPVD